jgi:hypothetical protein
LLDLKHNQYTHHAHPAHLFTQAGAENERAEVLSRTALGQHLALLSLYSQTVIESNKGVEKVVYTDANTSRDSPFSLLGLQSLHTDLQALSKLGIAAGDENAPNANNTNGGNGSSNNNGMNKLKKSYISTTN